MNLAGAEGGSLGDPLRSARPGDHRCMHGVDVSLPSGSREQVIIDIFALPARSLDSLRSLVSRAPRPDGQDTNRRHLHGMCFALDGPLYLPDVQHGARGESCTMSDPRHTQMINRCMTQDVKTSTVCILAVRPGYARNEPRSGRVIERGCAKISMITGPREPDGIDRSTPCTHP